jgi:hypothetical protein
MYVWLEKYFSRGDYIKQPGRKEVPPNAEPG